VATSPCAIFFADRGFNNAYVQVTKISDANGQPLTGHDAEGQDAAALGLSNTLGLWRYTAAGGYNSNSGILTKSGVGTTNAASRDWVFMNPDGADTYLALAVFASPSYSSYGRTSRRRVPSSTPAPPPVPSRARRPRRSHGSCRSLHPLWRGEHAGFYGYTSLTVNYNYKGTVSLEGTGLPGGTNKSLPLQRLRLRQAADGPVLERHDLQRHRPPLLRRHRERSEPDLRHHLERHEVRRRRHQTSPT